MAKERPPVPMPQVGADSAQIGFSQGSDFLDLAQIAQMPQVVRVWPWPGPDTGPGVDQGQD